MNFGYPTIIWGGGVVTSGGVKSVKGLFCQADCDKKDALWDISAVGYEGAEVFGWYPREDAEISMKYVKSLFAQNSHA